jgi:hypothetical protein
MSKKDKKRNKFLKKQFGNVLDKYKCIDPELWNVSPIVLPKAEDDYLFAGTFYGVMIYTKGKEDKEKLNKMIAFMGSSPFGLQL